MIIPRFSLYKHMPFRLPPFIYKYVKGGLSINPAVSRHLYMESDLGLDTFLERRNKIQSKFASSRNAFLERINLYCNEEKGKSFHIYGNDIKNLILMCENNEQELRLLWQIMKLYHETSSPSSKEDYDHGPEMSRLFFHFNLPEEGKKMIRDEAGGVMRSMTTYLVLMTMFFNEGYYEEVISAMHKMMDDKVCVTLLPKPNLVLTTAACYKLNTEKSLDKALFFIQKSVATGPYYVWRAVDFVAALALKQRNPVIALELISKANSVLATSRNIKIEALIMLGQETDALPLLKVGEEVREKQERSVFASTIASLEKVLKENDKIKELKELSIIKKYLIKESLLVDKSLDEVLCTPMPLNSNKPKSKLADRQSHRAKLIASFDRGTNRDNISKYPKKGSSSFK